MEELFLPYELSLLAKKRGFNEPCLATYYIHDQKLHGLVLRDMVDNPANLLDYVWNNEDIHESIIAAPLYQQIQDWLREKYKIIIVQDFYTTDIGLDYHYKISEPNTWNERDIVVKSGFKSWYESLNDAIIEAFKLIPNATDIPE